MSCTEYGADAPTWVSRIPVSWFSGSAYEEVPLPPSQPNWPTGRG
ncbi:hypothetical protein AB0E63_39695 [Kribbella sp. NPDC026596]